MPSLVLNIDILWGAGQKSSDGGKEEGIKICYKIPHNDKDNGDADEVDKTCDTLKSCVLAGLHLQLAPGRLDALQIFIIRIIVINFYPDYYY